jgi:hypothetical protein
MKRISFTMCIDADGKITVKEILNHIIQNLPEIKVPDADIMQIPLAALTLSDDSNKHCIDGEICGRKWQDGKYIEYEITLIFG